MRGFGRVIEIDDRLVIPDHSLRRRGAIPPSGGSTAKVFVTTNEPLKSIRFEPTSLVEAQQRASVHNGGRTRI